ncbi:high choriolytic enzyme 2-like [Denticeps clupeoides]|uniref:high choriolytic enzyme 2-like n=1 Tax=Denticeps clupeoides TaxID=299321 RepID=UPI0010A3EEAC|nr:high choriolytic enzyme 2-like [Denticeps clupeoides]
MSRLAVIILVSLTTIGPRECCNSEVYRGAGSEEDVTNEGREGDGCTVGKLIEKANRNLGQEHSFERIMTNNLDTSYDYNSVMHYGRDAFSRNGQPTIVPIPDVNVPVWRAEEMSANDILRNNRLYCD